MSFESIIGHQGPIEALLHDFEQKRVGHAYCLTGPRGIGKKTIAKAFAGLLLCCDPKGTTPCGGCAGCTTYSAGSNPDFLVIREENTTSIGVDETRDLLRNTSVRAYYSGRKVYLIADADGMTVQAQNVLLKTLEEPPGDAVILMTVSNYHQILETVRSRVRRLNLKPLTTQEMKSILSARFGSIPEQIDFILAYSAGVPGKAIQLIESDTLKTLRDNILALMERLLNGNVLEISKEVALIEENKEEIEFILNALLSVLRDLLVVREGGGNSLINPDKKDMILKNSLQSTVAGILRAIEAVEDTRRYLKQNANFTLSIEVMLMKLQEDLK